MDGTISPKAIQAAAEPCDRTFAELRDDLVRLAGEAGCDRFFAEYAGARVRIPGHVNPDSPLAATLGAKGAAAFVNEYAGEVIDVPMGPLSAKRERTAQMERLILAGKPAAEIARTMKTTQRAVRHARKRMRDRGQLP